MRPAGAAGGESGPPVDPGAEGVHGRGKDRDRQSDRERESERDIEIERERERERDWGPAACDRRLISAAVGLLSLSLSLSCASLSSPLLSSRLHSESDSQHLLLAGPRSAPLCVRVCLPPPPPLRGRRGRGPRARDTELKGRRRALERCGRVRVVSWKQRESARCSLPLPPSLGPSLSVSLPASLSPSLC